MNRPEGIFIFYYAAIARGRTAAGASAEFERYVAELRQAGFWRTDSAYRADVTLNRFLRPALAAMNDVVKPAQVKFWFGTAGPHVWPVPGKVNLAIDVSSHFSNYVEYPFYAMLRRLHEQYGDQLVITLFTRTQGRRAQTPTEPEGTPMQPAQEAEWLREYWLDYLKLPVNVAVDEAPVTVLPPPDGRRYVKDSAPFEEVRYTSAEFMSPPQLVDQTGHVVAYWTETEGMTTFDVILSHLMEPRR